MSHEEAIKVTHAVVKGILEMMESSTHQSLNSHIQNVAAFIVRHAPKELYGLCMRYAMINFEYQLTSDVLFYSELKSGGRLAHD